MKQFKFLLASLALLFTSVAWAQTDVTNRIKNADFSSVSDWTPVTSGGFRDFGNGLIGSFNVKDGVTTGGPATVDATHLDTEYCLGVECRWSGNFASFTQTLKALPAGSYTLTFDVENTNSNTTKLSYENRFFVEIGGAQTLDSSKEWMDGKSAWTTHTITFNLDETADATISLGYGTGTNNYPQERTPILYISHLKLMYTDLLTGLKAQWDEAHAAAQAALDENPGVNDPTKAYLETEVAKAEPTTAEGYEAAIPALQSATEAFLFAASMYNTYKAIFQAEIDYAQSIGVSTTAAEAILNSSSSTVDDFIPAIDALKVLEYNTFAGEGTAYTEDVSAAYVGNWSGDMGHSTSGQHWDGSDKTYFDSWSGNARTVSTTQTITLPAGEYVFMCPGRGTKGITVTMTVNGFAVTYNAKGDTGYGIDLDGKANFSSEGTYANNNNGRGWEWKFVPVTLAEEGDVTVTLALQLNANTWGSFTDLVIRAKFSLDLLKAELEAMKTEATNLLADDNYANVTGDERSTLASLSTATPASETKTAYETLIGQLEEAIEAFKAAKPLADKKAELSDEIAYAQAIGVETATAEAALAQAGATMDDIQNAINDLKVLDYETFAGEGTEYTEDVSENYVGTWTSQLETITGQHWSGDGSISYMDSWRGSATTLTATQTITLPAGEYVFMTPGRAVKGVPAYMTVDGFTATYNTKGDSGYGIDTSGKANFSPEGTYANNNNGRGWEWRFVPVTLEEAGDVTVTLTLELAAGTWGSFTDLVILAKPSPNLVLDKLAAAIEDATAIREALDEDLLLDWLPFQYDVAAVNALTFARNKARNVYNNASTKTMEEIEQATAELRDAIQTFNESELNAPEDGAMYNLVLTDEGFAHAGKPITFKEGQPNAGGYAMGYTENPGSPYNQAVMFEAAEGVNCYYMYIEDAVGNKHYVGTGANYTNGNNYQLRMTDDKEKALVLKAERKSMDELSFINTATNSYVGSNGDTGFFTNDNYHKFAVRNYAPTEFTLKVSDGKYGTIIFPYIPEDDVVAGLNFYTCEEIDGTELVLTKVDQVEIDKPYIVENVGGVDKDIIKNDVIGKAYSTNLTFGLLTGLYSGGQGIEAGKYVLQTKDGVQCFRKVPEGGMTGTKYRAYLTYNGGGEINALGFQTDGITAIRGIDALLNGEGTEAIYNAAGQRIPAPQKGLNIIKMSNGKTVKVLIK